MIFVCTTRSTKVEEAIMNMLTPWFSSISYIEGNYSKYNPLILFGRGMMILSDKTLCYNSLALLVKITDFTLRSFDLCLRVVIVVASFFLTLALTAGALVLTAGAFEIEPKRESVLETLVAGLGLYLAYLVKYFVQTTLSQHNKIPIDIVSSGWISLGLIHISHTTPFLAPR